MSHFQQKFFGFVILVVPKHSVISTYTEIIIVFNNFYKYTIKLLVIIQRSSHDITIFMELFLPIKDVNSDFVKYEKKNENTTIEKIISHNFYFIYENPIQ